MNKILTYAFSLCLGMVANAATLYSYDDFGSVGWSTTDPDLGAATDCSCTPATTDVLIITDAIAVSFGAREIGANGLITVRSGGSVSFSGLLEIKANGSLSVLSGGTVSAASLLVYNGGNIDIQSGGSIGIAGDFENRNNSDGVSINGSMSVGGNLSNGVGADITGTGSLTVEGTVTNNGTIGGSGGTDFGTLPVELTYFEVSQSATGLALAWQTASEANNDYFEVQRSEDGQNFYAIGKVTGHGTTDVVQNYQFADVPIASTSYYRLKQVDYNGDFEYSKIIAGYSNKLAASLEMMAYPNPATERLSFKSTQPISFKLLQLINLQGQVVANLTDSVEGFGLKLDVTLPRLEKGLYYVKYITVSGENGIHKLVIK